jgi:xanthine/CO dehydrogenase XdhC/CoxF family maturation factor
MFITETGQKTGVVSGGCLERDVCERATKVMKSAEPILVTYDTTSDDDIVWGLGIGCKGLVQILIEPAGALRLDSFMRFLEECSSTQRRGALATVIQCEGETEIAIGTRAVLYPDGTLQSDVLLSGVVGGPDLVNDLFEAVDSGRSKIKSYELDSSRVEVFIDVIEPQVPLVLFGAGDDVLPVVAFARNLGWHTTVVDTRVRSNSIERFAAADKVVLCSPEDVPECVNLSDKTAVVLMTHNYLHDLELLKILLNTQVSYVGCLGPKRRTEQLLREISGSEAAAAAFMNQLYAPAGLDIGAETPTEIAFSIVSEVSAVLRDREGGLLRNRKGSIHANGSSDHVTSPRDDSIELVFRAGTDRQRVSVA